MLPLVNTITIVPIKRRRCGCTRSFSSTIHSNFEDRNLKLIGVVKGAHGLSGNVVVASLTDYTERFGSTATAFLSPSFSSKLICTKIVYSNIVERKSSSNPYETLKFRIGDEGVVKFEGCDSRMMAEEMKYWQIFTIDDISLRTSTEEIRASDLLGYSCLHVLSGAYIGRVIDIHYFGNFTLELITDGNYRPKILVPLVRTMVRRIDNDNSIILLDPPVGLIC